MRTAARLLWSLAFVASVASKANAQPIGQPTTSVGGLFGPRANVSAGTDPRMSMTVDLGGGYDEVPGSTTGAPLPLFEQAGTLGTAGATLIFQQNTLRRVVSATAGGYFNRATVGLRQVAGGEASAQWQQSLGQRSGISATTTVGSQPAALFNAYGPVAGQTADQPPAPSPSQGVARQQWLNLQGGAGAFRNFTSRQRGDLNLSLTNREPVSSPGLRNRSESLAYLHAWRPRQHLAITPSYRFNHSRQRDEFNRNASTISNAAALVATWSRALGAGRSMAFGGGAGVTFSGYTVNDRRFSFTVPNYTGYVRAQWRSGWRVSLDAARDVSVLEGLTPEPFSSSALTARFEGFLWRRLHLAFSGAYADGGALVTRNGGFSSRVAGAQFQYALARSWALYTSYSYYRYRLEEVQASGSFPQQFTVNSVRAGLNVWLPLLGRQ